VDPGSEAEVVLSTSDKNELSTLEEGKIYIQRLAKVNPLTIGLSQAPPKKAARQQVAGVEIYVPLAKIIEVEKSRAKLLSRKQAIEKDITKVQEGLDRPGFKEKAPAEKVEAMLGQLAELQVQLQNVIEQLAVLDESD
jgi:valyl-tRNA synthetase